MMKIYGARCTTNEKITFSWKLRGDCQQIGYRIQVKQAFGNEVWDSGMIEGKRRHNIECQFVLPQEEQYRWFITCCGSDGSEDTVEGNPFFTKLKEWKASWIEPDRLRRPLEDDVMPHQSMAEQKDPVERLDPPVYMRRTFSLDRFPTCATAYITAHGIYALWINGTLVSDMLAPGYTAYNKRIEYQCYDVGGLLRYGINTIGVILADGWYTGKLGAVGIGQQYGSESALLMQLACRFADDSEVVIGSDEQFRWTTGALVYADLFVGECYDSGRELTGWLEADYDATAWRPVVRKAHSHEQLVMQSIAPIKKIKTITPTVMRSPKGELLLDAGETITGFVSFELALKKGDVITFEHTETLDVDGNFIYYMSCQNKHQRDTFICGQDGTYSWEPMFTYHGFRYVKVSGTEKDDASGYKIHVISSELEKTGEFRCSDPRLNQLQENIFRSQQGNMIGIPTDCPQREKTGWTGDVQVYAPTACFEMDMEQFLRHWLQDMANDQLPDGNIPHIIPFIPSHDRMRPPGIEGYSAAGWSDAAVIVPWRLYEAYGDPRILSENYAMMCRYMEAVEQRLAIMPKDSQNMTKEQLEHQKYLWNTDFQYGDWLMPNVPAFEGAVKTGSEVATLMLAFTTEIMQKVSRLLEENAKAVHFEQLNHKVKTAFAAEYMNPDGTMKKQYQGVCILALAFRVVPEPLRKATVGQLVRLIHENNDLLATGFLSVPYLLPVLHDHGEKAVANRLLFRDECPSWLYEVKMGATTMWESWEAYLADGTPQDYSMNHFAFGCVGEYLFGTVLGLRALEPGFERVRVQPDFECGLSFARGFYDSIWGKLEIAWEKTEHAVKLEVTIPPGVTAEIRLGSEHAVRECGSWCFEVKI